jgi:cbb3-type cytochrome oxidase maturation protein
MAIIVLLISVSLIIAVGFLISFLWNMKSGQYDDTYSPSVRMLFDDTVKNKPVNKNSNHEKHCAAGNTIEKV